MTEYRCIVADPPWAERGGGQIKRGADRHYPLLSTPEIAKTIIRSGIAPAVDAHLWLWVTSNFLEDGLGVMRALGFEYKTNFAWVKIRHDAEVVLPVDLDTTKRPIRLDAIAVAAGALRIGLGQYLRHAHELCLLGTRGQAMVPPPPSRLPSVIFEERTEHSRKPDAAFKIFEAVSPGPRIELFARTRRPGWDAWGNEVDGDREVTSDG